MLAAQLDNRRAVVARWCLPGQVPETPMGTSAPIRAGSEDYMSATGDRCIGDSCAAMECTANFW